MLLKDAVIRLRAEDLKTGISRLLWQIKSMKSHLIFCWLVGTNSKTPEETLFSELNTTIFPELE